MNNLNKYNEVFTDVFDINKDELNENFKLGSSEKWDSLGHITLITKLEETFDIMFETDDVLSFESYENGKKVLEKYGVILE